MKVPEIVEHKIKVDKTARYYVAEPKGALKCTLIAIHGYRQLGRFFIRNFEPLLAEGVKLIVPEGLHRFYIDGYSGKVGASWMTKDDRLSDIEDYINYLERIGDEIEIDSDYPLVLLGFSQGGPTACRWLASSRLNFDKLILHSTVFPNDFDFDQNLKRLEACRSFAIFGDDDEFASEETIEAKMNWMKAQGIELNLMRFKGGHQISLEKVREALK